MTNRTLAILDPHKPTHRRELEAHLNRDPLLHIYEIGDLDPFFIGHTRWFALRVDGMIERLLLLYTGGEIPNIIALDRRDPTLTAALVDAAAPHLPELFHAHLSVGVAPLVESHWSITPHGRYLRMALTDPSALPEVDPSMKRLDRSHLPEILRLYADAYPGNWFDQRMLDTGFYFGLREGSELLSIAGVHVVSAEMSVAALGNITTAHSARRRGLARRTTATLCQALLESVNEVGLNVAAENSAAIACYRSIGFETIAQFDEARLTRISSG